MRIYAFFLCALVLTGALSFAAGQHLGTEHPDHLTMDQYECAFAQLRPDMTLAEVRYQIEQEKKQPYIVP